jgi:hypothetical protein
MTSFVQRGNRMSSMRLRAKTGALTLALALAQGINTAQSAQAQTFTVLHTFTNTPDGATPLGDLFRDGSGAFYGAAFAGGDLKCKEATWFGCGTVWRLTP